MTEEKKKPGPKEELFKVEAPFEEAVRKAMTVKASELPKPKRRRPRKPDS